MQNIKATGRLRYVEPTNIGNEIGDNSNAISFPYEDYCMSVDLMVQITDRYSCGWAKESGEIKTLTYSSRNGSISFLGGSKISNEDTGYLTTNFTDISMVNPGENTSECLGIEGISISYGQWMFPQVVVKFVDVRGATVMQPAEHNYYNEQDLGNSSDLYKSLFSFPYPMFILKVKGFYGRGVTYKLTVQKTDLEFNSETGNFNITVSFIGYMYGVYSDMPMTYLAAAPFMDGGKEYWKNKVEDGTFCFRDSSGNYVKPMVTIPELRKKLAEASANELATSAAAEGEIMSENIDAQISNLKGIEDDFPFPNTLWDFHIIDKRFFTVVRTEDEITEIKNNISRFIEGVKTYDKMCNTHFFEEVKYLEKYNDISNKKISISFVTKKGTDDKYEVNTSFSIFGESEQEKADEYIHGDQAILANIEARRNNLTNFYVVFIDTDSKDGYSSFMNKLTGRENSEISRLQTKKNLEIEKYKVKEMGIIEKVLGFRPSIKNIYNLIFAHMDTFMHCFYSNTKNIRTELETSSEFRQKKYYNIQNGQTDTLDSPMGVNNTTNGGSLNNRGKFLPPYFALYKEENMDGETKNTLTWPGDLINGEKLQEVSFIKSLLSGAELYKETSDKINEYIESLEGKIINNTTSNNSTVTPTDYIKNFIPITNYDFVYKDEIGNPYESIKNAIKRGTNDIEEKLLGIFALRAFYYLLSNNEDEIDANAFGIIEGLNLFKAIGDDISEPFIKFIKKYADGDNKNRDARGFIDTITNPNSKTWNGELFHEHKQTLSYVLGNYFPVGESNFNQIKDDFIDETVLKDNIKYLCFNQRISGSRLLEGPSKSFYQIENSHYIEDVITNVENEINSAEEDLETKIDGYKRNGGEYGDVVKKNKVFKNYKSKLEKFSENVSYDGSCIVDKDDNFISSKKIKNVIFSKDDAIKKDYFIKFPSKVDESKNYSIFTSDLYKYPFSYSGDDDVNLATVKFRAMLFLQSIPIKGNGLEGGIDEKGGNGIELKSRLLREGAYYWWETHCGDFGEQNIPVEVEATKYEKPGSSFTFCGDLVINDYETINPIEKGKGNYKNEWQRPHNASESRVQTLRKMFEDWALSADNDYGFYLNEKRLTNLDLYIDKDINKGLKIIDLAGNNEAISDLSAEAKTLQTFLRDLFFKVHTTIELYDDIITREELIEKKGISVKTSTLKNSFKGFMSQLNKIYKETVKDAKENPDNIVIKRAMDNASDPFKNVDLYLTTYITLKSLYDKWLCSPQRGALTTWSLDRGKDSDFNNFIYVDSFYHDIGDKLTVNISKISSWLSSCLPTSNLESTEGEMIYTGKTLYDFITSVAQDSGGMLLALPQKFGLYNSSRVSEMFTPMGLYSDWDDDSSTFVFMYTYKPSEHLGDDETGKYDMNGWSRDGDGINLTNDEIVGKVFGDKGYEIPAFGVTYAKQNQSIFKNIRLNTESNGATEAGLAATFNIASKNSEGPRETTLYGQDLYRIFTQYSYKCSAECMGNMQIAPLMYFQLNNIPLWKGGYQILKVTHDIVAGNITTNFEGVRINRYAIPFTDGVAITTRHTGDNNSDLSPGNNGSIFTTEGENIIGDINIKPGVKVEYMENNVTELKPLICITPAHSPRKKTDEYLWSSRVVDELERRLRMEKYYDGSYFNVQRCNRNPINGYTLKEVKTLIQKHGSKSVLSVVPHWNGGAGNYHVTIVNKASKGARQDSLKLAECMRGAFLNVKNSNPDEKMTSGECNIWNLPESNTDPAPDLACACVLTENWFADFPSKADYAKNPKETYGRKWLESEDGIETIVNAHIEGIKKYLEQLTPPFKGIPFV